MTSPVTHISPSGLPIEDVIPELVQTLRSRHEVVLQAPPGAGKTTMVPLALLSADWLGDQRILMLEPRRLAARAAAERMAKLLNEPVGNTVGYRVRLDSKISDETRIEVVTEGILTRYLQNDPSLDGIGLVIFDEFHERSLDADLGLALALQGRKLFRDPEDGAEPLKLLIMSATLDDVSIAELLGADNSPAPVVQSEGRQFPVDVIYGDPWQAGEFIVPRVVSTVREVLSTESGSVLVFLPGQREIRQANEALTELLSSLDQRSGEDDVVIAPLFGDLSLSEQYLAIAPAPSGKCKVVLATAIAESSLTIKGITVVVDAGLSRMPMFDPRTGMTRLHTRRLSRAASVQRMGRAGRLQSGRCYRLWSTSQQDQLAAYTPPEMLQADLAPLALQLQRWGINDPQELDWLDSPPPAPYQQALDLLSGLGAIEAGNDGNWRITAHGEAMAEFPAHPRIAHMLLLGEARGLGSLACELAVLLSERDPMFGVGADIASRLSLLRGEIKADGRSRHAVQRMRQQRQQFSSRLKKIKRSTQARSGDVGTVQEPDHSRWVGFLLACAYPDRIAQRRNPESYDYLLSNGRAARLRAPDSLQQSPWLVIAHLGGQQGSSSDQIFMAAELDSALFDEPLKPLVKEQKKVEWDKQSERFFAEQQHRVGALVLSRKRLNNIPVDEKRAVLIDLIRKRGLELLPWNDALRQWQSRVLLLRSADLTAAGESEWPDISDEALLADLENWLGPYLDDINHINHFSKLKLAEILLVLLPWPLPQQLDELAPVKMPVPSGSVIGIDYTQSPPVLAVRLQEMFGCAQTPTIARGKISLVVHLLSPARRPLAVTQDLSSFWSNAYTDVKKDMKGRYPKHYWPDNPLEAEATARAKPRK